MSSRVLSNAKKQVFRRNVVNYANHKTPKKSYDIVEKKHKKINKYSSCFRYSF